MKKNHWYVVKEQSLAVYARNAGFDLAVYEDYSTAVQAELKKRAVKEALYEIEVACEDQGFDIYSIKNGVYVISLSNPLSIQYGIRRSQVIYIGIGNTMNRIESHYNNSLFDFMKSLSGANFDFQFAHPALKGPSKTYYKHVEYMMLEYFREQYCGDDNCMRYPILNKNAGSDKEFPGGTDWWKKPLKAYGKRPLWELKPTAFSDFAPLDNE
ncbi:MAG: hypothetical protein WA666_03120 [Nitrospirota bacterium]